MSSGTDSKLHMPIYPFLHELSVSYRHTVFNAVRRHSVLVICLQAQTVTYTCLFTLSFTYLSVIQTYCLQRSTEAFCLSNMSSGTDSNLHMPIYPFLHELSVSYRHTVFNAVRRHSVLVICLQAQTVTYTCLFTLSFTYLSVIQTFCLQRCTEAFCLGNMSWGTDRNLHMPIYPLFTYLSVIQTFCLQRCMEAFCLGNMSSGTDSNLHMPINPR